MTEDAMAEMERLNPQFRWNWRKVKSVIKWRAARLIPNITYAMGCRGHPGLVVKRCYDPNWPLAALYGADVEIKSLVDGVVESCSIFNCAPQAISRDYAEREAELIRTTHDFDIAALHGHTIEDIREWRDEWVSSGVLWYVLSDQDGYTVRSSAAMTRENAEKEVERLSGEWFVNGGISNPRIVEMLSYPAPPKIVLD